MSKRAAFNSTYIEIMCAFLMRTRGISYDAARAFVVEQAKQSFVSPRIDVLRTDPSTLDRSLVENVPILRELHRAQNDIIAPNGSVYIKPSITPSVTRNFIGDKQAARKREKKLALSAEAAGDKVEYIIHDCTQNQFKISLNSLPGGMGSPFNPFYDKGGYNAITALGRSMIATSYTIAEQMLGGNFAWFDEEEALNYLHVNVDHAPTDAVVARLCIEHGLALISNDQLYTYCVTTLDYNQLTPIKNYPLLREYIDHLTVAECTYLYYLGNYQHLVQESEVAKNRIQRMFDYTQITGEGEDPAELKQIDESLINMIACSFAEDMGEFQFRDLPQQLPQLAARIVACAKHTQQVKAEWDELFEHFGFQRTAITATHQKRNAKRKVVIVSDTDSVIFTTVNWVQWFTDDINTTLAATQVSGLAINWLIDGCREALAIWCRDKGCDEVDLPRINMKNEFFYPTMMLFSLKKTYAGVISVREGMMQKKPKPDIKGGVLRGSNICAESRAFIDGIIINDILTRSMNAKISGNELIRKLIAHEQRIINACQSGDPTFLKLWSIDPAEQYADPSRGQYTYYLMWETLFGDQYGHIDLPIKTPVVPLLGKIPKSYWTWVQEHHPDVYERWQKFLVLNRNRVPGGMAIDLIHGEIPEAIRPIMDWRATVAHNMKPLYLCTSRLGLPCLLNDKQQVLYSDLYSPTNPQVSMT